MLRRGRGFKILSLSNVIDAFVDVCVSVVFAVLGFGVWSLVYGALTGALVSNLYLVYASGWRPSLRVTRAAFKEMFGFGMGVTISELLTDAADRGANFVIGKVLGTAALGYFEKAQSLMNRPLRDLGKRTQRVLFPVFARIRHEQGRFRAAVRRTVMSVSLIGYPLFVTLIVLAPQVVYVLLGSQWGVAVVPFQILCITGVPRLILQVVVMATYVTGSCAHRNEAEGHDGGADAGRIGRRGAMGAAGRGDGSHARHPVRARSRACGRSIAFSCYGRGRTS